MLYTHKFLAVKIRVEITIPQEQRLQVFHLHVVSVSKTVTSSTLQAFATQMGMSAIAAEWRWKGSLLSIYEFSGYEKKWKWLISMQDMPVTGTVLSKFWISILLRVTLRVNPKDWHFNLPRVKISYTSKLLNCKDWIFTLQIVKFQAFTSEIFQSFQTVFPHHSPFWVILFYVY